MRRRSHRARTNSGPPLVFHRGNSRREPTRRRRHPRSADTSRGTTSRACLRTNRRTRRPRRVRRRIAHMRTQSSPLFFVRILVHEGTHAVQDRRAKRYLIEISSMKRDLINLTKTGREASLHYHNLKKDIDVRLDYARRWFSGIETQDGQLKQDINFECEATINEIKALKALNASPRAMEDSGYLNVCPSAKRVIDRWKSGIDIKNN